MGTLARRFTLRIKRHHVVISYVLYSIFRFPVVAVSVALAVDKKVNSSSCAQKDCACNEK